MDFVNNWRQDITLAAGATSLALTLPDGSYRLSITDSLASPTAWEIVGAVVAGGTATLTRGMEGTTAIDWQGGGIAYCSITAGALTEIFAALFALASDVSALDGRTLANESAIAGLDSRVTALEPAPILNGYVLRWIYSNGDSILTHVSPFAGTMEYAPLDLGNFSLDGATLLPDYNGSPALALNGSGEYVTELGMAHDPDITMFRITFNPNNRYADVTARIELDGLVLGETVFNSGSEGANPSVIEITI